jgi:hypothetical protein
MVDSKDKKVVVLHPEGLPLRAKTSSPIDQNVKIHIDPEDTVKMQPEVLVYGDGCIKALREPKKGTISWKIKFRDGREKEFTSPIRTTEWGSIKGPDEYDIPSQTEFDSQELAHETEDKY